MKKGQIILLPFPFADFSNFKLRPAVCLTDSSLPYEQVILAAISSIPSAEVTDTELLLNSNEEWFDQTGLKKTSIIKVHKLITVQKSYIEREIGSVPSVILEEVYKILNGFLKL